MAAVALAVGPPPARRDLLVRRIRILVAVLIAYNLLEAVVALSAGAAASSGALIGFGLDSIIEVSSAAALAWQFAAKDHDVRQSREHIALRVTAIAFLALAVAVGADSVGSLLGSAEADHSRVGIVLAAVSLAVMPGLSYAQRHAGRQLGSASAVADSKQTMLCTYLSAVLLIGLIANAALGWSWADPIAALVIAAVAAKEGHDAWRGDACCAPAAAFAGASGDDACGCGDACCVPAAAPSARGA
jgi:divalent metal cation (Fe/Co/Zn/Cd) transporter